MSVILSTPFLLVDAAVAGQNVRRMAAYVASHGLKLRPHTKTHKSRRVARMQLEAGACGLTVAKAGEAEVMADVSNDILLAYPAADAPRARRAAELALRVTLRVALDTAAAADAVSAAAVTAGSTVGILVDLDVGLHRTGVASPRLALELAQRVARLPGLRLDGLFCYPGHTSVCPEQMPPMLAQVEALLAEAVDLFGKSGLSTGIVSGGSTPSAYHSHLMPSVTEIRPGTYVFNDMNTVRGGHCTLEQCAARVIAAVVSDSVPGKVVVDAGSKTLCMDRCVPAPDSGHGYVVEYPEATIVRLTEEHGEVDISACPRRPKVGEQVSIIPNHICPCVNLQDRMIFKEGDAFEPVAVDARGMIA